MTFEQRWVRFRNSAGVRRITRSPLGGAMFESRLFGALDTGRRYVETGASALRHPDLFREVETFAIFIGHVKSGGTLIGSLLDAHPRAVIADEVDPLRYFSAGFSRRQVFHLLAKGARREAMKGRVTARRLTPYSLAVPGQWQGRVDRAQVMGDSRAGPTTRMVGDHPEMVERMRSVLGRVGDRWVHVVRNPFDPISAMVLRGRRTLADATADYAGQCARLLALREGLGSDRVLTVRYEDFTDGPAEGLVRVCRFLGLATSTEYVEACSSIVKRGQRTERSAVEWTAGAIDAVDRLVAETPFLTGYRWEQSSLAAGQAGHR